MDYVVLPVPIRLVFHLSCRYLAYSTPPQQSVKSAGTLSCKLPPEPALLLAAIHIAKARMRDFIGPSPCRLIHYNAPYSASCGYPYWLLSRPTLGCSCRR